MIPATTVMLTMTLAGGALAWLLLGGHCDSLGGPVVADARYALEADDATPLLKWVGPEQADELADVFGQVQKARRGGDPAATELAERYLLEMAVRLHRASEGAGFDGLKPADAVPPWVRAADEAIERGGAEALIDQLTARVADGLGQRFAEQRDARPADETDVAAGRRWVERYIRFVHCVHEVADAVGGGENDNPPNPDLRGDER
ncbi:MAG: hypothetical protein KGY99_08210 [Phycisphaerae bacterium]|nr:hypothetical protein [Phycisphaerae bacterium]